MGREAAQSLRVGKHCRAQISQHIALVDTDQGIQHGRILKHVFVLSQLIFLGRALQKLREHLRSKGQRQHGAAHCGAGGIASADIVIHKKGFQIIIALGQRRGLAGNRHHMLGCVQPCLFKRILHKGLVGQGLKCGPGLRHQDKERMSHINGV